MLYLGTPSTDAVVRVMRTGWIGAIISPDQGYTPDRLRDVAWAADNGCFSAGESFDPDGWLRWLDGMGPIRGRCLFAVLPDRVADAPVTCALAERWIPVLRFSRWPVAFVGQDGLIVDDVPWDDIDAYFVGGSTDWKLSRPSVELMAEAKRRGKWVHVGRVNSRKRFMFAAHAGADSADGTYIARGPDTNLPKVLDWIDHLNGRPSPLFEGAA